MCPDSVQAAGDTPPSLDDVIAVDARVLSNQLASIRQRLFPPSAQKQLRRFASSEAAALIGISDAHLRELSRSGEAPEPHWGPAGRASYSLEQINDIRRILQASNGREAASARVGSEHLQILAITNFKGGSGKTTTAAHLTQYLALRGYRVLAIDLDPQASLSALMGYQPETDVAENETLYGVLRYDERRRPLGEVAKQTYFPGIAIVPGNLELQEFEHETPRILMGRRQGGGEIFFRRIAAAIHSVAEMYDVAVIDCPPQLGFLTLGALCAATGVLVTVHPQMLDVASMSQFLLMTGDLLAVVRNAGGRLNLDFLRYLITRHEPQDGPQTQVVGFLRSLFGDRVLTNTMLKSTAISDAGLTKQTLYELSRQAVSRSTYSRAVESLDAVNGEIEHLMRQAWGRTAW
jgi:chromosome partitioning protein